MLALIAGQGALPGILAGKARPAVIAALEGFPPDAVTPDRTFRLETLGSLLADLRERGVRDVCLAGAIRRPPLDPGAVDAATAPLVPRIVSALRSGDDAALREVIAIFEDAGLRVVGADDLVPELLPKVGSMTKRAPNRDTDEQIWRAASVLDIMGRADIGQSCVVHNDQIIAVEAGFGTDWMLESLLSRPDAGGGYLYKAPKAGQDRRIDLPVIGPNTVRRAAAARLDGVVIEHRGVMLLDAGEAVRLADDLGIMLWVRKPSRRPA